MPDGATTPAWHADGVHLRVRVPAADSVVVDVRPASGEPWTAPLEATGDGHWTLATERLRPGDRYGFRVSGPGAHPGLLLLDPSALAVAGSIDWGAVDFTGGADTGPHVPWSVVVDPTFDWEDEPRPSVPMADAILYEANVRSFTARHPDVPPELRGTYRGMAHPAVGRHLVRLGITTLELLPLQQFVTGRAQWELGLRNLWGYDPVAWFAPHNGYATADTGAQVRELQELVRAMHGAGIEVVVDVVYNHSGEYDRTGPVVAFRGLDDAGWYRHHPDGSYDDLTGCRNTIDSRPPDNRAHILASLRHWVDTFHVDGFRFDLASTLVRADGPPDPSAPFLAEVAADPVLSGVKLIAEPWDATAEGYALGRFPAPWAEWNDRFRNDVRDVWRTATPTREALATRLAGSSDIFGATERPTASINFVTAHDGFTLTDLVTYEMRRNDANGEGGADGASDNRSWNCGVEGPTDDPAVNQLRARQRRNLLATLLVSRGVPMLLAGDELGRTQQGNNNAWCQDDEVAWLDWGSVDRDLLAFAQRAVTLRLARPELRGAAWLTDADVTWRTADGRTLDDPAWWDHQDRLLVMAYPDLVLVVNPGPDDRTVVLPMRTSPWRVVLDTTVADGDPAEPGPHPGASTIPAPHRSLLVLVA